MRKFDHYCSNLKVLLTAKDQDLTNEFIISGIIDKFFVQFELGWKVLKELLIYEGIQAAGTGSPREIIKAAYKLYPFMEEKTWLSMLSQRNNLSHVYDGEAARKLMQQIIEEYIPAFERLRDNINNYYETGDGSLFQKF